MNDGSKFDMAWVNQPRPENEWTPTDGIHWPDVVMDKYRDDSLKDLAKDYFAKNPVEWTPEVSPAAWKTDDFNRVVLEANAAILKMING
jgi:hypothetical protein